MSFHFENLDERTRELMLSEIASDISSNVLYMSKRFNEEGKKLYPAILQDAVAKGDESALAFDLKAKRCFAEKEPRNGKNGVTYVKVPENANETFAEGEFNRFYIRALALKALESKSNLVVYRAKHSDNPRRESQELVGQSVDPSQILDDLRKNIGIDTALGLPPGPNSGLSLKIA
jgi:hypothetical protein